MSTLDNIYQHSLVADVAYLDWSSQKLTPDEFDDFVEDMEILLQQDNSATGEKGRRLTELQAEQFVNRYVTDEHRPLQFIDDATGFAATLFYDTVEQKHVLAIRGTETGDTNKPG